MFRIDNNTAAGSLPTPEAAGTPGYFQHGDPTTGEPATLLDPDWFNNVQEELIGTVQAGGLTPDKTDHGQLARAIFNLMHAYTPIPISQGQLVDGAYSNVSEFYTGKVGWVQQTTGTTCSLKAEFLAPVVQSADYRITDMEALLNYKLVSAGASMTLSLVQYTGDSTETVLASETYSGHTANQFQRKSPTIAAPISTPVGSSLALRIEASWADDPDDFVAIAAAHYAVNYSY